MNTSFLFKARGAIVFSALALAFAHSSIAVTAPATVSHIITIQNKVAGKQTVTKLAGGKIKTEFSYRENGRGPDIFEEITVDGNGQMTYFNATGKSTFGAPIAETFTRKNGKATWQSKADTGAAAGAASSMYVPVESSMETSAITARALLKAKDGKLDALPSGQLSISKILDSTVTNDKVKKPVTLYAITGFGLEPTYLWMWKTANPATSGMLGVVSPGFSALESGWESNAEA